MKNDIVILRGKQVSFKACVGYMDDEIRERLHFDIAPCTDQEFLDAYERAHFDKYLTEFLKDFVY